MRRASEVGGGGHSCGRIPSEPSYSGASSRGALPTHVVTRGVRREALRERRRPRGPALPFSSSGHLRGALLAPISLGPTGASLWDGGTAPRPSTCVGAGLCVWAGTRGGEVGVRAVVELVMGWVQGDVGVSPRHSSLGRWACAVSPPGPELVLTPKRHSERGRGHTAPAGAAKTAQTRPDPRVCTLRFRSKLRMESLPSPELLYSVPRRRQASPRVRVAALSPVVPRGRLCAALPGSRQPERGERGPGR